MPSWSWDGRWIHFARDRTGAPQVWKLPAAGPGDAVMVTQDGGFAAMESTDGATLYDTANSSDDTPPRSVPASGGAHYFMPKRVTQVPS